MFLDSRSTLAEATAVGGSTGRRVIGDIIDLSNARDIGGDRNLMLFVVVTTAFTSGGSGTLTLELVTDGTSTIATDGSATEHITSKTFTLAELTVGAVLLKTPLPSEATGTVYERYLALIGNVGTAAMTAGALSAYITTEMPLHKAYPDGAW